MLLRTGRKIPGHADHTCRWAVQYRRALVVVENFEGALNWRDDVKVTLACFL